ncbi:MAG: multicopper oxidase domain-containing protein [Gemmatimonadota bacterium]|nr:multicopper oxidase domain-containing protein [Gemmatimonadota bacterium]
MRLFASALLVGTGLVSTAPLREVQPVRAVAEYNDNLRPAGTMARGELTLELQIQQAQWFPLGPGKGSGTVFAFAESGKSPSIPGPLLRVSKGTVVRVRVTNTTDTTMVVYGLTGRQQPAPDSLIVAPGATGEARFVADAEGTYYYWAAQVGCTFENRMYEDSQLNGAFIVDPAGAAAPADRVMLISGWVMAKLPDGEPDLNFEFFAINGRPWPNTERLTYAVGDSIRWRIINTTPAPHPMHLHGFYFRVDARGDIERDTLYWPGQRRMAVTELSTPGTTMAIAFSPDRPGGWVFHCHLNWHVVKNPAVGEFMLGPQEREAEVTTAHAEHDPNNHVESGMGGLMMGITITTPPGYTLPTGARRQMRLFVNDGPPPAEGLPFPRYAYVLQEGAREPSPDSLRSPGSTLVLTKGEPTSIWVVNRTAQPTQVHWHGLELDSPFDGVVGVGGMPGMPTPAIMPGDSFEVRITPPRAGTFMYHTHMDEVLQHSGGLWGAFLVMEPGQRWDPEHDLTFQVGEANGFENILNGTTTHAKRVLNSDTDYRFRLMNISMRGPNLQYWLVRDGAPARWTPLAKDGFDLPEYRRQLAPAKQVVSIGETYDYQVNLLPGDYALELRQGNGNLVTRVPIQVLAWQDPVVQIASAVLPLPEGLRAGATVLGYRSTGTPLVELRKGTNGMICLADDPVIPAFHVACYHESMEPFMLRGRQLRANGVTGEQVDTVRYKEVAEGKIKMPTQPAALWQLSGPPGSYDAATNEVKGARHLYVVYIPFATTATTGIPSTPSQDQPWLMFPGTPKAHIMFVPRM